MVFCRARHRNRLRSRDSSLFGLSADVSLARTLPAVWKKCAGATSERSKRRAVHRREPLVPRDAPGVFLPRHAHIPIPTNMVVASAVVAPCAVPARLGARKSYGAAAVRPASGATRVVPRRGAGACPPISEVPPRRRRADAERDAPFDIPRAPGRALRTPRTDARGRPTRHRTDKAIVVRDFRNLDARSRFEPTAASDRAPPSFSRLSRSRTTRILMSSDRIPLFMSSLSLRDEQSRRARPGALSVACSA